MHLPAGTRLGRYELLDLIGSGGMGDVYRARDNRLGRDVAIKVIGAAINNDPEIRRRFDREARVAASLDHPRICAVYDVGHDAGIAYLVMEFLEGQSLAARLAHGRLPLAELTGYAIEIAAALAYAHRHDVVHRDIKPGNVFLTPSGVKVLDFGLAKLRQIEHTPSEDIATLKTRPLDITANAVVPGTPGYVPPERLEGREEDHRSDVFAFGTLVYEMATGRRAFEAPTQAALITAIMASEPPPMEGNGTATPALEWLVRRCLKKDPDARWQSMSDIEAILKWIASGAAAPGSGEAGARRARRTAAAAAFIAAVAVLGIVFVLVRQARLMPGNEPVVALSVTPPPGGAFTTTEGSTYSAQLAMSPDGRSLAFVASGADGTSHIWIRELGSVVPRRVGSTANATYPFWSSDSRSLGFFAGTTLRRVELDGSPSREVAPASIGRGGSWGPDNTILFGGESDGPLWRVKADGTGLVQQTSFSPDRGDKSHRWPQFLPDGRHFLFFVRSADKDQEGVYLGQLDSNGGTFLVESSVAGTYAPTGQLLYMAGETLMARDLDISHQRLTGEPVPVAEGVGGSSGFYGAFSISTNGTLAYASSTSPAELAWVDRAGNKREVLSGIEQFVDFRLSPDGRSVAVADVEPHSQRSDIRIRDLIRGNDRWLTRSRETDASPVWSPDSATLVFRSNREIVHDLYLRPADASGADTLLFKNPSAKYPTDWAPDGRSVLFHTRHKATGWDVWMLPVNPPGEPRPLVNEAFDEIQGQISPDRRHLAYTSFNRAEQPEVAVHPLVAAAQRWDISVGGGSDPRWRADGSELFYVRPADGMLMAVPVQRQGRLAPGQPKALFPLRGVRMAQPFPSSYDVHPTGQRFLVRLPLQDPGRLPLTVLSHWTPRSTTR
jgi:eukaryotic-like serine/threonine-protein kinase